MLIAGEGNDAQDLSMAEVTGNNATTVTAITTVAHLILVLLLCPVPVLQPHHLKMIHKAKEKVMVNTKLTNKCYHKCFHQLVKK